MHVDVMDGQFIPNITMGPLVVSAARKSTSLPLDVHLMIVDPDRYIEEFVKAGASMITVHAEACTHLHRTIQWIKSFGVRAGVALNPATPACMIDHVIEELDMILVMTVNPGFGGQSFLRTMLPKIRAIRAKLDENDLHHVPIEVDGGISSKTAADVVHAGAQILVAGSAIYGATDRKAAICQLRNSIES